MASKKEPDYFKLAAQLNKLQLKLYGVTVDQIIEVDNETLTDEDIQNLATDISVFYRKGFKTQLDKMIIAEMRGMAENGTYDMQIQFMRGSIAALIRLKQWCEAQIPTVKTEQQNKQPNAAGIQL